MNVNVILTDLTDPESQEATIALLDHYSQHEMGRGEPLPSDVKGRLISGLRGHPMSRVFLAHEDGRPIGIAVCFIGFSTFKAKPLINIHDLAVHQDYRSQGVGTKLIDAVIDFARSLNCCAVTLEVRADNPARKLYAKKGFQALDEPLAADASLFGKLVLQT